MSVADKLGTGSSFGQVRRERSARGRAKAVAQGDVPAYELVRIHLDEVSPTPLNPRRNFGTDDELTRFGEELRNVQLAACVAVTRDAYLALWPDHAERIGSAHHVLVNGERRFRSAVHVGLDALDFVVRDDLASSRETFINHLLKENLDREDFDVIERARGVQELVNVCAEQNERGARSRAAEQLGKDRSWVTNQLVLLELPDEIQAMLSSGSMSERDGRLLARKLKDNPELDAPALLDYLNETKESLARSKALEKAAVAAAREKLLSADNKSSEAPTEPKASGTLLSADNNAKVPTQGHPANEEPDHSRRSDAADAAPAASATEEKITDVKTLLSADNKERREDRSPSRAGAEQAPKAAEPLANEATDAPGRHDGSTPRQLPYDDAPFIALHLQRKMEPSVFAQCARTMLTALREQHPDEYDALMRELIQLQQPV
ncbi:ParB/RepB/Spo0J family partition protein [Streptomyces sp. NPDC020298]|uniref:ParB/RepB/Spo0J family partition protein n=1 Tax=unclassified Streptomyces TaxID=2593676 RepID=UPI0033C75F76